MAKLLPTVFISATSDDLRAYRLLVFDELYKAGLHPVIQEYFPPDHRELTRYLRDTVAACDAVVCLIGSLYGAEPADWEPRRSYTQLEYDVAQEYQIPTFVFLTSEHFDAPNVAEDEDRQQLQLAHREAVQKSGPKWNVFASPDDLGPQAAQTATRILGDGHVSGRLPLRLLHPPKPPTYFAGRQLELDQLKQATERSRTAIVVVMGLGGQGKTTLVAEWWNREDRKPFDAGLWCTAYRAGFTFDEYLDDLLGYLLQGQFSKQDMPSVTKRTRLAIDLLQERRVLLVIDGFERWLQGWTGGPDDPDVAESVDQRDASFEGLDQFLSDVSGLSGGTHLIITTRALPLVLEHAKIAVVPVDENGRQLALEGLDQQAAIEMLRSAGVKGSDKQLLDEAESFDRHPLALTVLGTRLKKMYGGRIEQVDRIRVLDHRQRLYKLLEETRQSMPGGEDAEQFLHVATQCLEDPSLATIAAGMGWDVQIEQEMADDLMEQAISLADWQLASWDGFNERVGFHAIVKQYFSQQAKDAPEIHRRLSRWYSGEDIPLHAGTLEQMRPRILAIEHALCAGAWDECAELLLAPVNAHYSFVEWLPAWGHLEKGIDLLGRVAHGAPRELRLQSTSSRAALQRQRGDLPLALEELNGIVKEIEATDKPNCEENTILANTYVNRGNVLWQMMKFEQALADYGLAIDLLQQLVAERPSVLIDMLWARMNLGVSLRNIGQLTEALAEQETVVGLCRVQQLLGDTSIHESLAHALVNRGVIRGDSCEFEKSIADLRKAIELYADELLKGREELRPQLASAKTTLAATLSDAGENKQALAELDDAINVLHGFVREGRHELETTLALSLMNRANVLLRLRQLERCVEDCDRAVRWFQELIEKGRDEARGWLGHSLLIRAETRYRLGNLQGAADDRQAGFSTLWQLAEEGNHFAQTVYLRKSFDTARYLPTVESVERLNHMLAQLEVPGTNTLDERLIVELKQGMARIAAIRADLVSAGLDMGQAERLELALGL